MFWATRSAPREVSATQEAVLQTPAQETVVVRDQLSNINTSVTKTGLGLPNYLKRNQFSQYHFELTTLLLGGLVSSEGGRRILVGVVSFGETECGVKGRPGVYTNIR